MSVEIFRLWGTIETNRQQAEKDILAVEKQAERSGKKMQSDFDRITTAIGSMIKEVDKFGKRMERTGKAVAKQAGIPLAAITGTMTALAKTTADYGDRVAKTSQEVGLSVGAYQELSYALAQNGIAAADSDRALGRLNQRIGRARAGNEQYRESLALLGIEMEALDAGAVNTEEAFYQIIETLSNMRDGQMQSAIAADIFGTQVARKLLPAIRSGNASIDELRQRAQNLGFVMDEQAARKSELFGDTMDDLSRTVGGFSRVIGSELQAPLINIARWLTDIVAAGSDWIKQHPELVRRTIMIGGAIAGVLAVLVSFGTAMIVTGKIISTLGIIMTVLTSKPFLIIAAMGALWLAWERDWLGIRTAVTDAWERYILPAWEAMTEWLSKLWDAVKVGDWEEAWRLITQAVKDGWVALRDWEMWGKLWDWVVEATVVTWQFVQDAWASLRSWEGWGRLWNWVVRAAVVTWAFIQDSWTALKDWEGWGRLWGWITSTASIGWEFLKSSWSALGDWNGWSELWSWVSSAATVTWDFLKDSWMDLADWEGWGKIKGFVLDSIKGVDWQAAFENIIVPASLALSVAFSVVQGVEAITTALKAALIRTGAFAAGGAGTAATALKAGLVLAGNIAIVVGVIGALTWVFSDEEEREKIQEEVDKIVANEEFSLTVKIGRISIIFLDTALHKGGRQIADALTSMYNWVAERVPFVEPITIDHDELTGAVDALTAATSEAGRFEETWADVTAGLREEVDPPEWVSEFAKPIKEEESALKTLAEEASRLHDEWEEIATSGHFETAEEMTVALGDIEDQVASLVEQAGLIDFLGLPLWQQVEALVDAAKSPIDISIRPELDEGIAPIERRREALEETIETVEQLEQSYGTLLDAIKLAEGVRPSDGVMYGSTGFVSQGHRFGRQQNQDLFEEIAAGLEPGTEEYYRRVAATTVNWYWGTFVDKFPEFADKTFAELAPEIQQLFLAHLGPAFAPPEAHDLNPNWVPNVLASLGFAEGAALFREGAEHWLDAMVEGMRGKVNDLEGAAEYLADRVARYLVGESPPPEGPLSAVDEGGANVAEAWMEGLEEGIGENSGKLSGALGLVRNTLQTVWDKIPENTRGPIEDAVTYIESLLTKVEEALFSLDDFEGKLADILGLGDPEKETRGFMQRMIDALNDKLASLEFSIDTFVGKVVDATGALGVVVQAIRSGDWAGAFLTILAETESFGVAMEVLGSVLKPIIELFDSVFKPVIVFLAKTIAAVANFFIDAVNGAIRMLNKIPFVDIKQISRVNFDFDDPDDDPRNGTGDRGNAGGGRQVAQFTGPDRDLLIDMLSPLANLSSLIGIGNRIHDLLYTRLPDMAALQFEVAGAGAYSPGPNIVFEPGSIIVEGSGLSADAISDSMVSRIGKKLAEELAFNRRGRGNR